MKKSNPPKHIKDNIDHFFNWLALANAPKKHVPTKSADDVYIVLEKPTLNP